MIVSSLVAVLALAQNLPGRPFSEERQLLDRHLARLSRALPDAAAPGDDETLLLQLAAEAGLRDVEVGSPVITETGSLGQSRRTLTATSTYADADRFFRAVQSSPRLIDVESLILRTADFGVKVETRLRLYHRALRAVPQASLDPARMRDRTHGASREEAARFARDEQIALEKTMALDDLRRRQTSPRMFLAETGSAFRQTPAALVFASLDGDSGRFSLRGVAAGMGAADTLERRLEGGFFRVREFSRARRDGCYQFEAVGESFRAGPEAALPLPIEEPFRPTEPLCRQDRDATALGEAGAVLRAAGSDPGGLSLRAEGVDLADIGAMIETLSGEPFVIAADVQGRVNVDFAGASVTEAIGRLPVRSDRVGGVWLIRSSASSPLEVPGGEPAPSSVGFSLRAKRARGEDVLAALAEIDPAYAGLGPPGLPRLSVFARDAPAVDIRRAVIEALGLDEARDEGPPVLKFRGRPGDVVPITASTEGQITLKARDLTVDEFLLAGIGRSPQGLVAFAYSPLGELVSVRLGDRLADGVIAGVDSNGLLVDTSEGPLRISLPVPRGR